MKKLLIILIMSLLVSTLAYAGGMEDDPVLTMIKLDLLEIRDIDEGHAVVFEGFGWVGRDLNKLWVKAEVERVEGETEEAELQLLYGRAVAPFWDVQVGWRHDNRPEPSRDWLAVGVQGLAPGWFEVDTTLFLGEDGQTAARLEAEYELMFTQRLALIPEIELNFYTDDEPEFGIGSGLADSEIGLRLAYEIRREFAPYIGVNWERKYGGTRDLARAEGHDTDDLQLVAGVRAWF